MSQFIRLKHKDHTFFMHVEPTDSFGSVKKKLGDLNGKKADDVRIFHSDKTQCFEDEATIGDQQVPNDAVLYAVFRKGEGHDDYEPIDVQSTSAAPENKAES